MEIHTECVVGGTIYHCYCKWGIPRLFRYADTGQWDKIPKHCRRRKRDVMFRHKYAPADTALHRLMRPLNYCSNPSSGNIMEGSDSGDDSSSTEDDNHHHELFQDDDAISDSLLCAVQAIVSTCPISMTALDMFGQSPLHLGCLHELTPARTRAVLWCLEQQQHHLMADVVRAADTITGRTMLHHVAAARDTSHGVFRRQLVRAILKVDPHAFERIDKDGKRPNVNETDMLQEAQLDGTSNGEVCW